MKRTKTIAYCKSYMLKSAVLKKKQELEKKGYRTRLGRTIKEEGKEYCKLFIYKDFNYHILKLLDSIEMSVNIGKKDVLEACEEHKERLKEICKEFETPCRIEYDPSTRKIFAITNEKEFSIVL